MIQAAYPLAKIPPGWKVCPKTSNVNPRSDPYLNHICRYINSYHRIVDVYFHRMRLSSLIINVEFEQIILMMLK